MINKDASSSVEVKESSPVKHEPPNEPRVYESSLALPVVHAPADSPVMLALPAPRSIETPPVSSGKLRVPKRPTKVRLEAAPEQESASKEMGEQMEGKSSMGMMLSGSGIVESGRSEVAIENAEVKSSSIVMVMLAGDPGPVVVQYITLRPQDGFTVHLSAPAQAKTSFNYAILSTS